MSRLTKNQKISKDRLESGKAYSVEEALSLVKELANSKFQESIDVSVNLGVDP